MTDIRRCWAFHNDGMRCEHPAGHPGQHAVQRTWDDDECAIPGEIKTTPPPPPPPLVTEVVSCVACGHKHKGGECKCGCREFIG